MSGYAIEVRKDRILTFITVLGLDGSEVVEVEDLVDEARLLDGSLMKLPLNPFKLDHGNLD